MKLTFRWFGEGDDPIPLQYIRQIPGVTGLMGALDGIPVGEAWSAEEIGAFVDQAHAAELEVEVIESVNVHEDIKLGRATRDRYIENYCRTVENLAAFGIRVVVYNFMPVFDWLRTELAHVNPDGSTCLSYDHRVLVGMTPQDLVANTLRNSTFTLPGWEPGRLAELDSVMSAYSDLTHDQLRDNYRYFLEGVVPTCERVGVRLAVHPDDPAWELFGIPRICHSMEDLDAIVGLVDSPANSLCVCSGSLGSDPDNDVPAILERFGDRGRVAAAHVRNIRRLGKRRFQEAAHLSSDGSLDMYAIMKAIHDHCPEVYVRPDHGRMIWGETGRPGYPLHDRALGLTYLNGLWEAIDRQARGPGAAS